MNRVKTIEALRVCFNLTDAIVDRFETARSYDYHGESVDNLIECFKNKGDMPEPFNDMAMDIIKNQWERGEANFDWWLQCANQVRRNLFNEIEASQGGSITLFPNESSRPKRRVVTAEGMNEFYDPTAPVFEDRPAIKSRVKPISRERNIIKEPATFKLCDNWIGKNITVHCYHLGLQYDHGKLMSLVHSKLYSKKQYSEKGFYTPLRIPNWIWNTPGASEIIKPL
jgi:hypothetical protein